MRGIEWLKSFGASEHWIIGAWELETLVAWIVGTLGPLDSESNYKSPFESPLKVLLGRRVAFQPDLGASASEMTFGKNVAIPGEILSDPDTTSDINFLKNILQQVKTKADRPAVQPSRHNPPETPLADIPADVTHVYTRQHHTPGLQSHFEGPFRIAERTSRSVLKIEVGSFKDGQPRYEFRHLNDLKLAHPKSMAAPAERPKLGRPPGASSSSNGREPTDPASDRLAAPPNRFSSQLPSLPSRQPSQSVSVNKQTEEPEPAKIQTALNRPVRSTRNPNPLYVDSLSGPPPFAPFHRPRAWTASGEELAAINNSINKPAAA